MNLNKVMLIGNLTRDPETRTTPGGQTVSSFGLATNRSWRDQQSGEKKTAVEYHNIVAWGKLAEICTQYLRKGARIYTEGRLQTRSWDDQAGVKKYRTEIILENMIMLDRKEDSNRNIDNSAVPTIEVPTVAASEEEISVEDIPF